MTTALQTPASPPALSRADKRFNFGACLIDSVGWPLGMAFFSVTTILPVLMHRLGAGNVEIGALPALYYLLWFVPGLLVARYTGQLRQARLFLVAMAIVERLALLPLVFLLPLWGASHPAWMLAALFACIAVHAAAMGLNQPAYYLVIGKCIPALWRGRMFGYAGGVAGVLGIGVDAALRRLLSGPDGGFARGYADCFALGFVILMASCLPLGMVREPVEAPHAPPGGDGHYGRASLRVWREHHDFRRFLYAQMLLQLAAMALPFFVLHATHRLHAGTGAVAGYTATLILASSFGSLGWGAWADRSGNRRVVLASAGCAALSACLAVIVSTASAFYGVFAFAALASAGLSIAGMNLVMEYAALPAAIPLYTALYNLVTALPRAAAPLLGGWIADRAGGYLPVFVLSLGLSLGGLLLMRRAGEPRRPAAPLSEKA